MTQSWSVQYNINGLTTEHLLEKETLPMLMEEKQIPSSRRYAQFQGGK